jgi:general L-amino acid transport system permease protein
VIDLTPLHFFGRGRGGDFHQNRMTDQTDKRFSSAPPKVAPTISDLIYSPKLRAIASQIIIVALLAWGIYEIVGNTQANLKRLNQNFGYDFLSQSAGFDILTSLISYQSSSTYGRAILVGFWNTLMVSVIGIVLATLVGFLIGIMRLSKNWLVSRFATVYVETIRNVPLLLQCFIWYALVLKPLPGPKQAINISDAVFISNRGVIMPQPNFGEGAWFALALFVAAIVGTWIFRRWAAARQAATGQILPVLSMSIAVIFAAPILGLLFAGWPLTFNYPELSGFNFRGGMTLIPEFLALLAALVFYTASFIAEIVRGGIQAVSHGQTEAAHALGLSNTQTLRQVVIPQAMRIIIPPLTNQYLNLTKNSSLGVAIGYPDLVATGGTVLNQSGKAIEVVSILMIVYLALSLITSLFMNWYNDRVKLVER